MFKKTVFFITVLFSFFLAFNVFAADVAKIGVIDFQKILKVSDAGKAAFSTIKDEGEKMESDLKKKREEIEELKKKIERESLVMSKEMREEKGRDFRIKINDLKSLEKTYQAKLYALEKRHIGQFKKDIFEIAGEIGKKKKYILIVDKAATIYYPDSLDITDAVIKKYNAKK